MKILINGCSFSRGPESWPYFIRYLSGASIWNLALAGAGNTYIRQSTINEISLRSHDLVIIMWSGLERLDFQVNDIDQFPDFSTSSYQSDQNDWPEKIVKPWHDQDFVEKNWILGGIEPGLSRHELFRGIRYHTSEKEHIHRSLIDMICMQGVLKSNNIPFVFAFYQNYVEKLKNQDINLFHLLDTNCLFNNPNISDLMKDNDWYDVDGQHPSTQAHQTWAMTLYEWLKNKNYAINFV